jgi:hypothetical protein
MSIINLTTRAISLFPLFDLKRREYLVILFSDKHGNRGGEKSGPGDAAEVTELLVSGDEGDAVDVAIVLDLAVNLVGEEGLDRVVELVLEQVSAHVLHGVMGPVGVLNAVQEAIVLGHPKAVLEGLKVSYRVQRVS